MASKNLIELHKLCKCYEVEMSFFQNMQELGLIEITSVEKSYFINVDHIRDVERILRLHRDLHINLEGVDAILNLIEKMDALRRETKALKARLRIYENREI